LNIAKVVVELLHFRLKVWQHQTSLMKGFAHSALNLLSEQYQSIPYVRLERT
jgi:hypothetical protein